MIKYLDESGKALCRPLWEEAFPDDTEGFLDGYFGRKVKDSRVLAAVDESDGRVLSMIHRNPYTLAVGGLRWNVDYLVACATAKDVRGQGYNRELVKRLFADLYREGAPVTFLMPAIPGRYRALGFAYVSAPRGLRLRDGADLTAQKVELCGENWAGGGGSARNVARDGGRVENAAGDAGSVLADWMNRFLDARYEVHTLRDRAYAENLLAELASEGGWMEWLLRDHAGEERGPVGLRAFWGRKQPRLRLLYCEDERLLEECAADGGAVREHVVVVPAMMARVICVREFIKCAGLSEDCPALRMEVPLVIRDRQIPENSGFYRWSLSAGGSALEPFGGISPESGGAQASTGECLISTEALTLTVEQLMAWLWGAQTLQELEPREGIPYWCGYVRPVRGVFLDEVV